MTIVELILTVLLILAIAWIAKREQDVSNLRAFCRKLKGQSFDGLLHGFAAGFLAAGLVARWLKGNHDET